MRRALHRSAAPSALHAVATSSSSMSASSAALRVATHPLRSSVSMAAPISLHNVCRRRLATPASSVPPRPGSEPGPTAEDETAKKMDYTEYLAKMDRLEDPGKGGLPRANKLAALLTGIPMLLILYHMLFPTPLEQNEWYQLEQQHRDRVRRAMEEANAAGGK